MQLCAFNGITFFADNWIIRSRKRILTDISRNLTYTPRYTCSNLFSTRRDLYVAEPLRQFPLCGGLPQSGNCRRKDVATPSNGDDTSSETLRHLTKHVKSHRKTCCLHASRKLELQESASKGQFYAKKLTYPRSSCTLKTSKHPAAGFTDLRQETYCRAKQRPVQRIIPLAYF